MTKQDDLSRTTRSGIVVVPRASGSELLGDAALIVASSVSGAFPTCRILQVGEARYVRNVPYVVARLALARLMINGDRGSTGGRGVSHVYRSRRGARDVVSCGETGRSCIVVGIGELLVEKRPVESGDFGRIKPLARHFVQMVLDTRRGS